MIRFSCCLSSQPEIPIEIICDRLASHVPVQKDHYRLLLSIANDLPKTLEIDPLHNQHVNYLNAENLSEEELKKSRVCVLSYDEEDNEDKWSSNIVIIYPSSVGCPQLGETAPVRCLTIWLNTLDSCDTLTELLQQLRNYGQIIIESLIGDVMLSRDTSPDSDDQTLLCRINRLLGNDTLVATLELVQEIQKCQCVLLDHLEIMYISPNSNLDHLILKTVQLSKRFTRLEIINSALSTNTWKHIAQQLHRGNKLEVLYLEDTKSISVEFLESISSMTSTLTRVTMDECEMTSDLCRVAMLHLSHCHNLTQVNLAMATLTGSMQYLTDQGNSPQFPKLKRLDLSGTKLNKCDVTNLGKVISSTNAPKLQKLGLSCNILTDCLKNLLEPEIDLPSLRYFFLSDTRLTAEDLQCLGEAVRLGRLPSLSYLRLGVAESGSLVHLFESSDHHPQFSSLEGFMAWDELNKDDLIALSNAIQRGQLDRLIEVTLRFVNMEKLEDELKNFIQTCKSRDEQRKLTVWLVGHYVSLDFKHKLESMSSGMFRVPTAPGKPGKMVTVFPAWKNPGILSILPNILEK